MNDLTCYRAVRNMARPVDVVAFWAPKTNPLSLIIEEITGGPSHVALVRQGLGPASDVTIIQSTIEHGVNGVQTDCLAETLAGYPKGSRAALYRLTDEARTRVDLGAFYAWCGAKDGHVRYSIANLVKFLLLPDWITQRFSSGVVRAEVCSQCVADGLEHCGATCGVQASRMKPSDVIALPILRQGIALL